MEATTKVCAKCDKEKEFKEFNPGLASYGLKRICMDCQSDLNAHYKEQHKEVLKVIVKNNRKEKSEEKKKERKKTKTEINTEIYKNIEKEIKALIYFPKEINFPKEKRRGEYKTAAEIIEELELEFPKRLIYRVLAKHALKGRANGTARYFVKYRDI